MITYIGLDIADTTGIALWRPETGLAHTVTVRSTPLEQLRRILLLVPRMADLTFVLEMPLHFRNANTTRSLLERYGYLKFALLERGFRVEEVHLRQARSFLGEKDKTGVLAHFRPYYRGKMHLTDHETDALVVALYQADCDGCGADLKEIYDA